MVAIISSTMDLEQAQDSTGGSVDKESACNAGDVEDKVSIPGLGRSPGEGHGNPLQSCENYFTYIITFHPHRKTHFANN